jgi:NAD(P)-dependent dehydrogenase (short-subunit alcohol dehydrogenase family)
MCVGRLFAPPSLCLFHLNGFEIAQY